MLKGPFQVWKNPALETNSKHSIYNLWIQTWNVEYNFSKYAQFPKSIELCCPTCWQDMLCNNTTRWPLTHLCCLKQLCPKNLCATNAAFGSLSFVFWNLALRNPNMDVLMASDSNGCTDFPSQQKSFVKLADISMLCDNMTRWPLTHLCSPEQLCPKNLCATNVAFVGLSFVFWNLALRNPNMDVLMASDGNGCTDFPSQQKSCVKLADISMLCDNMTRWPLTHLCCLKQLCPKNLCATNRFCFVKCWNLFENLSVRNGFRGGLPAHDVPMQQSFAEPAEISTLCQNMWHI